MNWLTWLDTLPPPIQEVLTGATGDLAGGLVGGAISALLGRASGRAQKYFAPDPKHEALQRAMARAIVVSQARNIVASTHKRAAPPSRFVPNLVPGYTGSSIRGW